MKQEIEQIIKNNLPEKKENPKNKCINAENHLFGRCFSCEKNNGFNDCLAQINTSLIADEVLKVVVEKIKKQKQKYIKNNERDMGGWQDEIDACKKIIKLITNSSSFEIERSEHIINNSNPSNEQMKIVRELRKITL